MTDTAGRERSLTALRGRPAALLFWRTDVPESRAALEAMGERGADFVRGNVGALAIAVDEPGALPAVREAAVRVSALPVAAATRPVADSYAILNRYLFLDRHDLYLPTVFLLSPQGDVVKIYRGLGIEVGEILKDAAAIPATPPARLEKALPFAGVFHSPLGVRNYLPYGRELLDQGFEAPALGAFARAAQGNPTAYTLYTLGTLFAKTGQPDKAKEAFLRALEKNPEQAEAENDLGALLAQGGDMAGGMEHFRAALRITPDYPDALNNLGYALLLGGQEAEARTLYEKALKLQPDFPEALNNLGLILARKGDLAGAEPYFRRALASRAGYGEAANNLALVLVGRGQADSAVTLLESFVAAEPGFEDAYVTLAKIHLSANRRAEAQKAVERLLQRNPTHPTGMALARELASR